MTELEKLKITELYALGNGYKKISRILGIPSDSVKTYIRRHGKDDAEKLKTTCMQCGTPITQPQRKQLKKFCSDMTLWLEGSRKQSNASKKFTTPSETEKHGAYKPTTLCVNSKSKKALLQSSMRSCGTPWLTASQFTMKPTSASSSKMVRNTEYKSIKRTPHYLYGGEEFF